MKPLLQAFDKNLYRIKLLNPFFFISSSEAITLQQLINMLKSLLSKIKSEKSSVHQQSSKDNQKDNHCEAIKPIDNYQFSYLTQKHSLGQSIPTIRYSVESNAPNIFNRVLSCPISVFNVLPYGKRKVKEIDLRVDPCPEYIKPLTHILKQELPTYNHILINVYPPGIGIMPHFDGPMYFPKVIVLSLGGPSIISFTDSYSNTLKKASLLLQDRSIHIFESEAYKKYLHGIGDVLIDCIFVRLEMSEQKQCLKCVSASVENFQKTRLFDILNESLKDKVNQELSDEMDLTSLYGSGCYVIPVKGNSQFNLKVQLVRKERISITIRQKFYQ